MIVNFKVSKLSMDYCVLIKEGYIESFQHNLGLKTEKTKFTYSEKISLIWNS